MKFSTLQPQLFLIALSISICVAATSTVVVQSTITVTNTAPAVTISVPASDTYTNPALLKSTILNSTNFYRYEHNATFLSWNTSLAAYAQNWASGCVWAHSHGPPGENLALGYPNSTLAVDAWGDERSQYDFQSPTGFTEATGHFTQLVWKDSVTVGCGTVDCTGKNNLQGVLLVCEYWPAGNIVGNNNQYFVQNVDGQVNTGRGYNETAGSDGTGSATGTPSGSANPTPTGMGDASSFGDRRRIWGALAATTFALVLAGGMV